MYEKFHVFTRTELESRAEIKYENYAKTINIEAKAMINIASKRLIPAVIRYTTGLAESINAVRAAGIDEVSVQTELLQRTSSLLRESMNALRALSETDAQANTMARGREQAKFCHDRVAPAMEALRRPIDELEQIVDKSLWPMPSYGDLLFEV
jgi:glutamine synthetase